MTSRIAAPALAITAMLAWAVHFTVAYGYTAIACARGHVADIAWAVSAAGVLAACVAAAVVWRSRRRRERDWLGAGVGGLALFAIALETLPAWVGTPCA